MSLRVEDSHAEGEDVVIRARPGDEGVALHATITDTEGALGAEGELRPAGDGWQEARVQGLGVGAWRVAVGGDGAVTVTDVFFVI